MLLAEVGYEIPGPWYQVAVVTTLALPVVAAVGAAVLIGPSSDLVNFIRAVGGVLAGLATYFGAQMAGLPSEPQQFTIIDDDGRVLTDAEVKQFHRDYAKKYHLPLGGRRVPGWRPSGTFVARYVLFVCIVPPVAGVLVASLIAEWK